ncbi:MAG: hypothetical protein SGI77_07025 [Pirellulaceae bacterium]|nr:hypothetical protein [Pirellulaceae bacterium]
MTTLQPIVRRRLLQFQRRRSILLVAKGLSAAVLVAVIAGLMFAAIDARWSISTSTRWMVASAIYVAMGAVLGILSIGPWLRGRSLKWLASLFEQVEPSVKHRLLAALELSDEFARRPPETGKQVRSQFALDSADFRTAVQRSAARRMEPIDIRRLLPWKLIRIWLWMAALATASITALCLIPDLHLANRLGRILFPMANIGRVSKFAIEIRQPSPPNRILPEEYVVPIQVAIRGGNPSFVFLETDSSNGGDHQQIALHQEESEGNEILYQTHWTPGSGQTRYRVIADDASTAWYQMDIRARPKVEEFKIDYHFPAYTKASDTTIESEHGDIEAVQGTVASLSLVTNQKIASAELRVQTKDRSLPASEADFRIDMIRGSDGNLTADIPIERDAVYRVELIAVDTQFTNTYSPRYSLRAIPDQPPTIRWKSPTESSLAAQPDQILDLQVSVEDELPLTSLIQQIKFRGSGWTETSLNLGDLAKQEVAFAMDLATLNVQPGEMVQTRLVATDRKGQSTISSILELYISSMSLNPSRQTQMRERVELVKQVEAFSTAVEEKAKAIQSTRNKSEKNKDDVELRKQLNESMQEFGSMARQESAQLRQKIIQALPRQKDSVSAVELELLAQTIAKLETENLTSIEQSVEDLEAPQNLAGSKQAYEQISKFAKSTSQIARRSRDFVSHDVLSQVGQDLTVLLRYQQELKNSVGSILPEQYRRRQMLVARQMEDIADLLSEQMPVLRNRSEKSANQWTQWLETQAAKIYDTTGKNKKPLPAQERLPDRERLAQQIEQELLKHQNSGNIDSALPQEQLQARKELRSQAGPASRSIDQLAQAVSRSSQSKHQEESELAITQELLPAVEQVAIRRELQQARSDGDNQFVADLGEAYRAIQVAMQERRTDPASTVQKLDTLRKSLTTLEAIHELDQAAKMLEQLHSTERWEANSTEAHFEQPRVWDAFQQQMSQAVQALANAKIPKATLTFIQDLQKSDAIQRIDNKIGPRRWSSSNTASAAKDIEELQSELRLQVASLADTARSARQELSQLTPSVADLAHDAAENVRSGSEETKRLSEAVAKDEVPETAPRIEQLKKSIESSKPALQQLRESLADTASRQNLLEQSDARIARDADAAVAITREVQKQLNQSVESIAMAEGNQAVQQELDASVATQNQSADSLDKIADHFEALNEAQEMATAIAPANTNTPSNELVDAAAEIAKNPELDRAHSDAERLRRLASLDPKRVLEQLEKELVRNTPMQTELSAIAKDAVEEALNTLEYTAEREMELDVGLENSDVDFSKKKDLLHADVKRISKTARSIADTMVPRVQSTADQAQTPGSRIAVQLEKDQLEKVIKEVEKVGANASIAQVVDAAKRLTSGLDRFRAEMFRQAVSQEMASKTPIANNRNPNRQREMEETQSTFREEDVRQAFANEKSRQQETNHADQEVNRAEKNTNSRKRDVQDAERKLAKQPENKGLEHSLEKQQSQLNNSEDEQRAAQAKKDAAESRQAAAKAAREQLQLAELKPLNAANPAALLSSRLAIATAMAAKAAEDEMKNSLGDSQWTEEPKAGLQALTDATSEQEGLASDVKHASDSLNRASRHEHRLENPINDAMIAEQASQVAAIADGSMQQAQAQLSLAAAESSPSSPDKAAQASSAATRQSQLALQSAEQALREQAASLRSASIQASQAKAQNDASNKAANKSTKSNDSLLSPQEMARMLDELDQQLNSQPKEGESLGASGEKSSKSNSKSGQQAKSAAEGDPSEAAADDRAQSLSDAAQRLTSEMNQQRQAMESAAKTMPETGAPDSQSRSATEAGKSSAGIVLPVEIANLEDWGKLRQQSADNTLEGDREQMMPAYRRQIEEYFRVLSKRQKSNR